MKLITLMGSPRKAGNTASVLGAFEKLLPASVQVERINVCEMEMHGCTGCDGCQTVFDAPGCVQEDDTAVVLQRILAADAVVYASPVYCWSFPAEIKALMDRHYALVKWDGDEAVVLMKDKPVLLLLTCGGGADENVDLPAEMFRREIEYLQARHCGAIWVDHCGLPAELGERSQQAALAMLQALSHCLPMR